MRAAALLSLLLIPLVFGAEVSVTVNVTAPAPLYQRMLRSFAGVAGFLLFASSIIYLIGAIGELRLEGIIAALTIIQLALVFAGIIVRVVG